MPTAIELATAQLRLHCNRDLERIPLNKVLDGLWSVLMWASGLSAEMNFEHISAKQKGMHIGTAAVFVVADCLLRCHLKQQVLARLEISIDFLLSWLFLDGKNFGRKPEGALRALAGLFVANGMAILKGRARTQQSHQVGQLLCPDHRSIFWPKSFPEQSLAQRRQAIDRFVHLQLLAARAPNIDLEAYGCNLQNCAVLYQWLGPSRYVGVASLQRASRPGMPGPALRWWEHLLHWSRRSLKGSQLKKYVLFRKASGSNMGFLISRAGPSTLMYAAEQLEIRCHQPAANGSGKKRLTCNKRPRHRPPRSCRGYVGHHLREGTFEGGVASAQFEKALARVSSAQQYNAHRAEPQDLVRALGMDFRSAYRHVQQHRFAQSGVLGPLNIYSPGHWRLLLLFLGSFGASVHWACVDKHWRSPCSAILLWKKAKLWLVGRRLQLAQQKFDDLLHSRRLPSTRGFTITVPQRCFIPAVKSALRLGVASQPSWDKMMRNYVVESTRIAVGKVRTFADKQNCAQQAQVFDWDEVRQCSDSELADAVRTTGARRVETNWRVPMPSTREDDLSSVKQCLRVWCGAFLSPKVAKTCRGHAARQLEATRAWKMHRQRVGALTAEHEHIFSQFSAGKQEVICPDDKMKQYKWIVPKKTYFLMVAFFVCVSSAWCAVDMSVEEAQAWCVALLTAFVPARLRRQFGVVPGRWFLPYCCNSMKPKCFSNGRRSCEKPGHSCMRRIVSYVKWPARRMWRQAGRALTFILQMTICTDEIWALNTARRGWSRAEDGAPASCQTSRAVWPLSWCLCRNPGNYCRCGPVLWMRVCLWSLLCVGRSTDVGPEERPYNCHGRWQSCGVFWRLYLQIFAQMPSFLHGGSLLAICSSMLPSVCIHWYAGMVLFWTPDRGIVVEGGRLDSSWLARALLEFWPKQTAGCSILVGWSAVVSLCCSWAICRWPHLVQQVALHWVPWRRGAACLLSALWGHRSWK